MPTLKFFETTREDKNGNIIYLTDPNGNEIGKWGKAIGGFLVMAVTVFSIILIIAHWPDKMPPTGQVNKCTKYEYKWFKVKYLGNTGESTDAITFSTPANQSTSPKGTNGAQDPETTAKKTAGATTTNNKIDSPQIAQNNTTADSAKQDSTKKDTIATGNTVATNEADSVIDNCGCKVLAKGKRYCDTIDLNTLILLLVAFGGFLGNMIHISSSFTNFVGGGKFKRSWMLWYFVKPLTAAALAVGVYIIFRAGFLNSADATASVNLYGVIAIAILAGLYTDMASLKLKEVFGVVFNTSTVRADPLELPAIVITGANPKLLPVGADTSVVISGSGFKDRILKLKINDVEVDNVVMQPNSIAFTHKPTKADPELIIYDEKDKEVAKYILLTDKTVGISGINDVNLPINTETEFTITGTNLDSVTLDVTQAGNPVTINNLTQSIDAVKFKITAAAAGIFTVIVKDATGKELLNTQITAA